MGKPEKVIPEKLIGEKADNGTITITEKDCSLYALGVGFNMDPMRDQDFKFTNEWSDEFTTFPTMTATLNLSGCIKILMGSEAMPNFGLHQLLHAEEKLYMIHPSLKMNVEYRQELELIDAVDKGKNAFFYIRQTAYVKNEHGKQEMAFYVDHSMFIRGLGGFGFKGTGKSAPILDLPKRAPDNVYKDKTFPSQALFYRLCDDRNPLHIDPNMAQAAGFPRPIIHGMASYGTVARNLVQNLLNNEPERLKAYQVRLIGHVFPGESFVINTWKEGDKIHFLAEVEERKTKALVGVLHIREMPKL